MMGDGRARWPVFARVADLAATGVWRVILTRIQTRSRCVVKTLPLSEVKAKLSELVDSVERRDEPLTITRNGKPVAIIVSRDEYESWHETVDILRDPQFVRDIQDGVRRLARTRKRQTIDELFRD
jgi:prevent-host-death family protein